MNLPIYQVDAFTSRPFGGNPAAVCLLDAPRPDEWMLNVAQEMNLSETAYLLPEGEGWRLRWFTPAVEVDLCGHATLASAHVLWESGRLDPSAPARFFSRSGPLGARRLADGWLELDFPARPPQPAEPPPGLLAALGVQPVFSARFNQDYLLELENEQQVRAASPDFAALLALGADVRAVILTSRAGGPPFDLVSRFFAPRMGVNEDPVTGSAHTLLAPYWAERLGRADLHAFQASRRGGVLRLQLRGGRVGIAGQAVTVLRGQLAA